MDTTTATHTHTAACPHCHPVNRVGGGDPAQAHCGKCGGLMFAGHPVELDEAAFARHLQADIPMVVDFWAPWCGPCRMMAPIYEQAAAQLEPGVRLAKVNSDEQGDLAGEFAIQHSDAGHLQERSRGCQALRGDGVVTVRRLGAIACLSV